MSQTMHYREQIPENKRSKLLREITSDEHICRLAHKLIRWEEKFYLFDLKYNPHVHDIKEGANKSNPALQR